MERVYLDWAATSLPNKAVLEQMKSIAEEFPGNPSTIYAEGKQAKALLNSARNFCAESLSCRDNQLIFTSGGSESNNMVLFSLLHKKKKGNIVTTSLEHPSSYEPAQKLKLFGWEVRILEPDSRGLISADKLAKTMDKNTELVSVIHVSNETGVIQDIASLGELIEERSGVYGKKIHFHSDAVQGLGKFPYALRELKIDSLSFSAHKIGGPRGVGLLYLKKPISLLFSGGDQEQHMRPGTENLSGIMGLKLSLQAMDQHRKQYTQRTTALMDLLITELLTLNNSVIAPERLRYPQKYSPYILSVAFPPLPGEVLVRALNDKGFAIATGAACSSSKKNKTRVLDSLKWPQAVISSSIRVSLGWNTTEEEILAFCRTLKRALDELI